MPSTPHGQPSDTDAIADRQLPDDQPRAALGGEPALIIGTIVAVIAALQQLSLPLPASVNAVITLVLVVAGALGIRQRVTPA